MLYSLLRFVVVVLYNSFLLNTFMEHLFSLCYKLSKESGKILLLLSGDLSLVTKTDKRGCVSLGSMERKTASLSVSYEHMWRWGTGDHLGRYRKADALLRPGSLRGIS